MKFKITWQKEDAVGNRSETQSVACDSYSAQWGGTHIPDDFIPHIDSYILVLADNGGEIDLSTSELAWIEFEIIP